MKGRTRQYRADYTGKKYVSIPTAVNEMKKLGYGCPVYPLMQWKLVVNGILVFPNVSIIRAMFTNLESTPSTLCGTDNCNATAYTGLVNHSSLDESWHFGWEGDEEWLARRMESKMNDKEYR